MDFTVHVPDQVPQTYTGEARYHVENGVLTVYADGSKLTYSSSGWTKVDEAQ